jgi:hypothetical protein
MEMVAVVTRASAALTFVDDMGLLPLQLQRTSSGHAVIGVKLRAISAR